MRGFSLLEIVLYLALFTFMLTGLFVSAAFLHDSMQHSKVEAVQLLESMNARDASDIGTHEL